MPVTLLGGYLGAGKTTVINQLLARTDRPIAVLVNDIGTVNVDGALIARRHGDTIELTDGCVCCSLSRGLADAFDRLRSRSRPPDHVVLEMSGVAEPGRVIPWAGSDGFRLDGVVVVVDAEQFLDRVDHPTIGPLVKAQVEAADLLLLSKTDLIDTSGVGKVIDRLSDLAPKTPVVAGGGRPEALAGLLDIGTRRPGGVAEGPAPTLFDLHESNVVPVPDPVNLDDLGRLLDRHCRGALRAKAVVRDPTGDHHLVQIVGARRHISPLPRAEQQPTTDLVVIRART